MFWHHLVTSQSRRDIAGYLVVAKRIVCRSLHCCPQDRPKPKNDSNRTFLMRTHLSSSHQVLPSLLHVLSIFPPPTFLFRTSIHPNCAILPHSHSLVWLPSLQSIWRKITRSRQAVAAAASARSFHFHFKQQRTRGRSPHYQRDTLCIGNLKQQSTFSNCF